VPAALPGQIDSNGAASMIPGQTVVVDGGYSIIA
jgi:hypothetical protein